MLGQYLPYFRVVSEHSTIVVPGIVPDIIQSPKKIGKMSLIEEMLYDFGLCPSSSAKMRSI